MADAEQAEQHVDPLKQTWQSAVDALESQIKDRQTYVTHCQRYHDKYTEIDTELFNLNQQLNHEDPDLRHAERVQRLKVRGRVNLSGVHINHVTSECVNLHEVYLHVDNFFHVVCQRIYVYFDFNILFNTHLVS